MWRQPRPASGTGELTVPAGRCLKTIGVAGKRAGRERQKELVQRAEPALSTAQGSWATGVPEGGRAAA